MWSHTSISFLARVLNYSFHILTYHVCGAAVCYCKLGVWQRTPKKRRTENGVFDTMFPLHTISLFPDVGFDSLTKVVFILGFCAAAPGLK